MYTELDTLIGAPVLDGIDFADVDAQGRLSRVVGFFGPLPSGEGLA